MNSWKKRWKNELDTHIPDLDEGVRKAPIVCERTKEEFSSDVGSPFKRIMRAFVAWLCNWRRGGMTIAAVCLACLIGVCAMLPSLLSSTPVSAETKVVEMIAVDCDAEAVFSVDEEGFVLSVTSEDGNADVIFSSLGRVEMMKGIPVETALSLFVDYAAKLGFLDFTKSDAIRLTSMKEEGKLGDVEAALVDYFCAKGAYVAVATEQVNVVDFAEGMGFSGVNGEEELFKAAREIPVLYAERRAVGLDEKELQSLYRETIPVEGLKKCFAYALQNNLDKIEKNLRALEHICALTEMIKEYEDNPYRGFADYWALRALNKTYSDALNGLLDDMDEALSNYEKEYDEKIDSLSVFATVSCAVSRENAFDELSVALENFTTELFEERFEELSQMLKNVGMDISVLENWYQLPENHRAYTEKTLQYNNMRFYLLLEKNYSVYEAQRVQLQKNDYAAYVEKLQQEYGSLFAYWNSLQKK